MIIADIITVGTLAVAFGMGLYYLLRLLFPRKNYR